jgi:23S rRNA (adenine2030-N6)-methyltransferase
VWYPIKNQTAVEDFLQTFGGGSKALRLELHVPQSAPGKLAACGVLVLNPPWKFDEAMAEALPWVARQLGRGVRSSLSSPKA